nr:HAMP domain-containing sensor histidine kinase [uncultured Flavobacterium sp.]
MIQYIDADTLNQKTLTDLGNLKEGLNLSQTLFKEVKNINDYNKSIKTSISRLNQIQENYKSSVAYKTIIKNDLLAKKINLLNEQTTSLSKSLEKNFNYYIKSKSDSDTGVINENEFLLKCQKSTNSLLHLTNQYENLIHQFAKKYNSFFLKQSSEEETTKRNLTYVIAFFSLVLLLFLINYISEVFRVKDKLDEANVKIQGDLILKNKILSLLTHEIKTPVSVINMSSFLISEKMQDQEVKDIFGSIQYSSNALTLIANQALELVKLDNNEDLVFDPSRFDIHFEIKQIVKSLQVVASSSQIQLQLHTNFQEPFFVWYDKVRLYQLLYNLLGNALKFANHRIEISVNKIADSLFFEIVDDGQGMSEAELKHVFELNYQGKQSQVDTLSMGLGMHLCKRIIEKSSGTIAVSNLEQTGLKVNFKLDFLNVSNAIAYN